MGKPSVTARRQRQARTSSSNVSGPNYSIDKSIAWGLPAEVGQKDAGAAGTAPAGLGKWGRREYEKESVHFVIRTGRAFGSSRACIPFMVIVRDSLLLPSLQGPLACGTSVGLRIKRGANSVPDMSVLRTAVPRVGFAPPSLGGLCITDIFPVQVDCGQQPAALHRKGVSHVLLGDDRTGERRLR